MPSSIFIIGEPTPTTFGVRGFRLLRRLKGEPWKRTVVRVNGRTPDLLEPEFRRALLTALGGGKRSFSRLSPGWPFDLYVSFGPSDGHDANLTMHDRFAVVGSAVVVRCVRGQPDFPTSMRFKGGDAGEGLEDLPYAHGDEGKAVYQYGPAPDGGFIVCSPALARGVFRVDVTTAEQG